jgi:ChpA-C
VQMRTRAAGVLAVAASAVAMMGAPAFASNSPSTGNITGNYNVSTLSGNNVQVPVQMPVNFCGNALAILGFADAGCQGGAAAFLDSFNSGS